MPQLTTSSCAPLDCVSHEILSAGGTSWLAGDVAASLSLAEAASRASCHRCDVRCSSYAGMQLALMLAAIRRVDQARQVLSRCTPPHATGRDPQLAAVADLVNARITLAEGRFEEAVEQCNSALLLAERQQLRLGSWVTIANLVNAEVALRRGDLSTMIHYANRLKEDAVFCREIFPFSMPVWIIVQITEAESGREAAAPLARELLESESAGRRLLLAEPTSVPFLVRMMRSTGEQELADRAAVYAGALATANPDVRSLAAAALHTAGLVRQDVDLLRRAAQTYGDPWASASAHEDVAAVLATTNRRCSEAREILDQVMRAYAGLGSLRDSSRVRSRLRDLNTSTPATGLWPRSRIPGLTDTEYAVAKLVAKGLTNGQAAGQMYLSQHTIAFHLRKIFQKLGLKSRLELAMRWKELDEPAADGARAPEPTERAPAEPRTRPDQPDRGRRLMGHAPVRRRYPEDPLSAVPRTAASM
jgi:DNA-binding NarL/FixJ family response regulator